jgi:hypothetical protein
MRHQRNFAEPARPLVRIQYLVEDLFAARGLGCDDASDLSPGISSKSE